MNKQHDKKIDTKITDASNILFDLHIKNALRTTKKILQNKVKNDEILEIKYTEKTVKWCCVNKNRANYFEIMYDDSERKKVTDWLLKYHSEHTQIELVFGIVYLTKDGWLPGPTCITIIYDGSDDDSDNNDEK